MIELRSVLGCSSGTPEEVRKRRARLFSVAISLVRRLRAAVMFSFAAASFAYASAPIETAPARLNEVWGKAKTEAAGIVWRGNHTIKQSEQ